MKDIQKQQPGQGGAAAAAAIPAANRSAYSRELAMRILFAVAAAIFILVVLVICVYLLATAIPTIAEIGFVDRRHF